MAHSLWDKIVQKLDENLDNATLPSFITGGFAPEDFQKLLESGELKDKYFFGVGDFCQGYYIRDMFDYPGFVCIGQQGSGKSTTVIGICNTLLASNGDRMALFMIDTLKGMGDYAHLFKYKKSVFPLVEVEGHKKLIPMFDILGKELKGRTKLLAKLNSFYEEFIGDASRVSKNFQDITHNYKNFIDMFENDYLKKAEDGNVDDHTREAFSIIRESDLLRYEATENYSAINVLDKVINNEPITKDEANICRRDKDFVGFRRILVVFEEFHDVVNHPVLNFIENKNTTGTIANKFFSISRVGRAIGVHLGIATQRAGYNEYPKDLGAGIVNQLAHRVSDEGDASGVDLGPQAKALPTQFNGRIATKDGQLHYPHFPTVTKEDKEEKWRDQNPGKTDMPEFETQSSMVNLLDKYYEEPTFEFVTTTPDEIHAAISGKGTEGLVMNGKIEEIVSNRNMFEVSEIAKRLSKDFGFTFNEQANASLEIDGIMEKDGERYALLGLRKPANQGRGYGGGSVKFSNEQSSSFSKQMKFPKINCDKVFILSFEEENSIPSGAKDLYNQYGGYMIGAAELSRIGKIYGNIKQNIADGIFDDLKMDVSLNHPPKEVNKTDDEVERTPSNPKKTRKFDAWDDLD